MSLFTALLYAAATLTTMNDIRIITDFSEAKPSQWLIINDGVMGGTSAGKFHVNEQNIGIFSGNVSLENNGGFTSIRYRFAPIAVSPDSRLVIRLRGDNKLYQLRVKPDSNNEYAYTTRFKTTDGWQTVSIALADLKPTFRGRTLEKPNFNHPHIAEIGLLITNKTAENFQLSIDWIGLEDTTQRGGAFVKNSSYHLFSMLGSSFK